MTRDDNRSATWRLRTQTAVVRTLADEVRRQRAEGGSVEHLEGQVLEESTRLASTIRDLRLRRSSRPAAPDRSELRSDSPGEAIFKRASRILLVEDDEAARAALVRFLEPDYEVGTACDGIEGLERASLATPDVVVADIGMPRLDGISMVARMKNIASLRDIPVVFLTAETEPESIAAAISAGGHSYLTKPIDLELLEEQIRAALSSRSK